MPPPSQTFGKRRPERPAPPQTSRWGESASRSPLSVGERSGVDTALVVPNSIAAGVLTGAVIGVLQLALQLGQGGERAFHLGPLSVEVGVATLPLILTETLWAGGRAAFVTALVVHALLRRLGRTSFVDYAVVGGVAGLVFVFGLSLLGMVDAGRNAALESVLGALAGVFYRLFAGARIDR